MRSTQNWGVHGALLIANEKSIMNMPILLWKLVAFLLSVGSYMEVFQPSAFLCKNLICNQEDAANLCSVCYKTGFCFCFRSSIEEHVQYQKLES